MCIILHVLHTYHWYNGHFGWLWSILRTFYFTDNVMGILTNLSALPYKSTFTFEVLNPGFFLYMTMRQVVCVLCLVLYRPSNFFHSLFHVMTQPPLTCASSSNRNIMAYTTAYGHEFEPVTLLRVACVWWDTSPYCCCMNHFPECNFV